MRVQYDSPGIYTIHVAGLLNEAWSDRLGGLSISTSEAEDAGGQPQTVLNGYLPDQAALLGVLTTLYNNRFPVTLVRYLRPYPGNAMATQDLEDELPGEIDRTVVTDAGVDASAEAD